MADINLLPWREQKREKEKKQFTVMLSGGFIGGFFYGFLLVLLCKSAGRRPNGT